MGVIQSGTPQNHWHWVVAIPVKCAVDHYLGDTLLLFWIYNHHKFAKTKKKRTRRLVKFNQTSVPRGRGQNNRYFEIDLMTSPKSTCIDLKKHHQKITQLFRHLWVLLVSSSPGQEMPRMFIWRTTKPQYVFVAMWKFKYTLYMLYVNIVDILIYKYSLIYLVDVICYFQIYLLFFQHVSVLFSKSSFKQQHVRKL